MNFIFDDALSEEVVEQEFRQRVQTGDLSMVKSFRDKADDIYENAPLRKRGAAFSSLYRKFIWTLGYPERVSEIFEEVDKEARLPSVCILTRVMRRDEEGAQLSEDGMQLGIQIRSDSLLDVERCRYLLRHELTHILDILDPAFGYDTTRPLSEVSPSEESLFRDRYRTLWDLSVDGRLESKWHLPQGLKEQRAGEFKSLFSNLGTEAADRVIEILWGGYRLSSGELRQMVTGAVSLCAILNIAADISDEVELHRTYGPGSSCPLCQFPTHEWAETGDELSQVINEEYPDWEPKQGICSQCANRYLFTAAFSTNSSGTPNQIIARTSNSFSGSSMEDI
ncbi:MAG: hypothetical protein HOC91_11125 [Nitrospinaceae bacterium]|jgi:hypothetical protein|nr:hypothetical protein [Nitrospinaceae bacterium]MBT3434710.1 hypothetical protein [Nitrospinaceae bacterium]MBT3820507.1 hypothetical protein [Nitrospinaceae bacterium]MBT4094315.1 hypothetical protein [Nitrospinaceae bacterium]MBT4431059.1 hypothetical protein [Nitrospinaceae bacterium]